ncbi:MAG: carotenoid oxygenase family protein [Acidobacteria bacterium]|nr:carotenoid oxygenase family protein [Acidobacteriota bacterium]
MQFSRREFSKLILGAGALGLIDIDIFGQISSDSKRSMRYLATQTASGEGTWTNLKIEGKVPRDLNGDLFRTAPGQSEKFGVKLNHLFDGDAYVSAWRFNEGKVSLQTRFVPIKGRLKELDSKKMLFNEYGTLAPDPRFGSKNQPSVNIIEWRGKLLGLSEGSLPTIIDPDTFDFDGYENFGGVVPDYLTFTAHPRFDPETGDMFAFGFEKRPPGTLHIIRVDHLTGKAETLYQLPQRGFNMVHDAMLTENYFVILILPTAYDMQMVMSGKPMGEALKFAENQPAVLYAFPRDNKGGKAEPIAVELPPYIIYHYGNAYEVEPGKIRFETIAYPDKAFFEVLQHWRADVVPDFKPPRLKQITVDLSKRSVVNSTDLAESTEFPRYDLRLTGKKARYLYCADKLYDKDAALIRIDLEKQAIQKAKVGNSRTIAEPVFVPKSPEINEDRGWILAQGYDASKNENFLEILDAQTMEFTARIWAAGQHFPLGFHGNFDASK